MGMAATVLFMKDDGAGLIVQPELVLNPVDCILEGLCRDVLRRGRVQAQGVQELFGLRASAERIGLVERAH